MSSDYSHHTIIRYNQAIASIRRLYEDKLHKKYTFPQSLDQDVDEIMTILRENYQQSTLNNFISSILWCLTTYNTSAYDVQYIDNIKHTYRMIGQTIKEQIERDKIGKEFELTEKEKKSFMIWEDVLKVYEKISKNLDKINYNNFLEFVIVSLYVLHPPTRADYANMKVFIEDSLIPPNYSENYCVLQTNPRFVFNQYKNAKSKGQTIVPLDEELHNILHDWMQINTSDYLLSSFVKSKQEFRPFTEFTLCRRIQLIFNKYANIPVTINTLRHSFISYSAKHELENRGTRVDYANKMMHSLAMSDKYRRMVY
jgi:hypothetical protein